MYATLCIHYGTVVWLGNAFLRCIKLTCFCFFNRSRKRMTGFTFYCFILVQEKRIDVFRIEQYCWFAIIYMFTYFSSMSFFF